jgi:hypothetical protein
MEFFMDIKEKVDDLCTIYEEFNEEGRDKMMGIMEKVFILQKEIRNESSNENELKECRV